MRAAFFTAAVVLLPMLGPLGCESREEPRIKGPTEYDDKWRNARYAHLAGKVAVAGASRERFVQVFSDFGTAHDFSIEIYRNRPGPPGTLPWVVLKRGDGVEVDAHDYLTNRFTYSLRQPAPRTEWKSVAVALLEKLTTEFGGRLIAEYGTWVPLGEGELLATLWGGSRSLNRESEPLFQESAQIHASELILEAKCLGMPCSLKYMFADDQLFRVQLTIRALTMSDRSMIQKSIASSLTKYFGPPDYTSARPGVGDQVARNGEVSIETGADQAGLRWKINFMQIDWYWSNNEAQNQAVLEYTDLDLVPDDFGDT